MDTVTRGSIALIKSAITGEGRPLPEDFDLEEAYAVLKKHHMDALIYEGAAICAIPGKHPLMMQLFQKYCRHLQISEGQLRQVKRIFAAFEEAGIDYMPLKGSRMKFLYPKTELRYMGDADILIRMEQYPKIVPIMQALGFEEKAETVHELHWKHRELNLELHKQLIPSFDKDLFAYFGIGWDKASDRRGHCWTMKQEDEWIYLFSHFTKHFRDGGIGCRHVADLWVYLRNHPQIDEEYIRTELARLQLSEFHGNIRRLIAVWFEEEKPDEKTEVITEYVFSCGSWGNLENRLLWQSVRNGKTTSGAAGKLSYLLRKAFPERPTLEGKYPVLKKAPWLLPAVWLHRIVYKLIYEFRKLSGVREDVNAITTEKMDARREILDYMGLKF